MADTAAVAPPTPTEPIATVPIDNIVGARLEIGEGDPSTKSITAKLLLPAETGWGEINLVIDSNLLFTAVMFAMARRE